MGAPEGKNRYQVKRLDEGTDPEWVKALIYGKPGSGKTNFGVTAPKPLILLSERQGSLHIKQAAKRLGVATPPTFLIESVNDLRNWLEALQGDRSKPLRVYEKHRDPTTEVVTKHLVAELQEWPETVVLDSLTDAARLIVEEIKFQSPPQKGKDGLPAVSMNFWNVLNDRFRNLVIRFRDLPMHVVFLALLSDREEGEGNDKTRAMGPDLPMRKLEGLTASCVNLVGYAFRREVREANKPTRLQYAVMTTGPEFMLTKPYRPLADVERPNFAAWISKIQGQLIEPDPTEDPLPVASQESSIGATNEVTEGGATATQEREVETTEQAVETDAETETEAADVSKKRGKKGKAKCRN